MVAAGLMDAKIEQYVTYVELDELHSSKHDAGRDAERYCIREVGLDNLVCLYSRTRAQCNTFSIIISNTFYN
jgi:hypothetical protein